MAYQNVHYRLKINRGHRQSLAGPFMGLNRSFVAFLVPAWDFYYW